MRHLSYEMPLCAIGMEAIPNKARIGHYKKISLPLQTAVNWSINRRVVYTHEFHTKSTIETELSLLGISYLGILLNTHT